MEKSIANPKTMKASQVIGRITECQRRLEEAGLSFEDWQAPIDDAEFRQQLVEFWRTRGQATEPVPVLPTSHKRAKDILGKNFISIDEVKKYLGTTFSGKDVEKLAEIPWSEETLESVKDTHILLPGHPLSILEIREKAPKKTFYSYGDAWYNNQSFATKEKVELRWYLIRKDIQPNSTSKTYQEQLALLSKQEENPKAVEMVYAMTLFWLARKEKLFTERWARCADLGSDGSRVFVNFCDGRLSVNSYWGDNRNGSLGVASSRKFQS